MIRASGLMSGAALLAAVACSDTPTSPTNVPYSQTDLIVGTGATAVVGSRATVQYGLWLYDGSRTENKGEQIDGGTFSFVVGDSTLIRGFNQGVTGMRVGGLRRIVIPPELGYGSNPPSGIPANATLIFDVQLTAVS